jgi:hypothetical protein
MAEKKEKKPKAGAEPEAEDSLLVSAAKTIGATAGKIAALAGAQPARPPKPKKPKLAKKNKSRMPRKQKKVLQKAARAKQG